MYTRPPTIVGCDRAIVTAPRLKAHFSFRAGTFEAVSAALRPSWNLALFVLVLHPFQRGAFIDVLNAAVDIAESPLQVRSSDEAFAVPAGAMYPISAKICGVDKPCACVRIAPLVSARKMASPLIAFIALNAGTRPSGASWHDAHRSL